METRGNSLISGLLTRLTPMTSVNNHIAFRVDQEVVDYLARQASAEGVKNASLYAKKILLESLDRESQIAALRQDIHEMSQRLDRGEATLEELRRDLSVAFRALMVSLSRNKKVTAEQARQWAEENLYCARSAKPAQRSV